jgi:hypothetical protein
MVGRLNAFRATAIGTPLLVVCALAMPVLQGCGGGGSSTTTVPKTVSPTASIPNDAKAAPTLTMPASRFAVSLDDLGNAFITNVPDTYVLTLESYAGTRTWKSVDEGKKHLTEWGYLGGYETSFRPEGDTAAVLKGAFNVYVETDLFGTPDKAKDAFAYFTKQFTDAKAPAVDVAPIGNEAVAYQFPLAKIGSSSVSAVDHRLMFRRGNLIVVVRTTGAEGFMNITQARTIAQMIDEKALGTKPAIEPTPTGNFTPTSGITKASPSPTP